VLDCAGTVEAGWLLAWSLGGCGVALGVPCVIVSRPAGRVVV